MTATRAPGRPRDASREAALLEATVALLAEVGYDNLTIDAVAARAGAGKATVYRRWADKAELVAAAMRCEAERGQTVVDTGSLRTDLHLMVERMREKSRRGDLGAMAGMIGAVHHDPALATAFRAGFVRDRQAFMSGVLARAQARGELPADADLELLRDVVPGVVLHRLLLTGDPVDGDIVDRLVDLLTRAG